MPEKNQLKTIKAAAFDWSFKALMGVILWVVMDMHNDLKDVLKIIPALQQKVDDMKDQQLKEGSKWRERIAAKHEEPITYDSLMRQP